MAHDEPDALAGEDRLEREPGRRAPGGVRVEPDALDQALVRVHEGDPGAARAPRQSKGARHARVAAV